MLARTRSTRLFVVLLHLVGVSTDLPPSSLFRIFWNDAGIVGVNPASVLLESSDPSKQELDDLQPHWLQDAHDQKCLGPMGTFSECGDATLWRVIPTAKRHSRRRQWGRWATEDDDLDRDGYALQVFDGTPTFYRHESSRILQPDSQSNPHGTDPRSFVNEDFSGKECLTPRKNDNALVLRPCSEDRAWFWKVNELGILHYSKSAKRITSRRANNEKRLLNKSQSLDCVWRNATAALLLHCDGRRPSRHANATAAQDIDETVVQIEFVRQVSHRDVQEPGDMAERDTLKVQTKHLGIREDNSESESSMRNANIERDPNDGRADMKFLGSALPYAFGSLPSQIDVAHSHAMAASRQTEPRSCSRVPSILPQPTSDIVTKQIPRFLGDTNPILVASHRLALGGAVRIEGTRKKIVNAEEKPSLQPTSSPSVLRDGLSSQSTKPIVRKIHLNPYIAASKDELWTDPQTGLVYMTDLCQYLGHERKDVGRHTLTGVGQYTKTMLNIKVYGVAFYVSKRDILADPSVEPYASLSSEELRKNSNFYRILRGMKGFSNVDEPAGSFDRTLFLKTNMQLATDTMRSSLDSDWKMLTQEAKDLLIGSSMKARPAGPRTLEIIQSKDNPSRCSCAQIAPDEYNADPSCCARGTELVFTWRKNGDFEVRLNGVHVDSFPRPDIAEGIFFEYLRLDNPMSLDFLDRVVEGLPFLLAPLSQVKGVGAPAIVQSASSQEVSSSGNVVFRTIGGVTDAISNQAASLADFVQSGAHELSTTTIDRVRSVGTAARNLGEEVERRRDLIGKHVSAFTHQALSSFYSKDQKSIAIPFPSWVTDTELSKISEDLYNEVSGTIDEEGSGCTRLIARLLGIESSTFSVAKATQKFFFGLVHLYLLILLIASFPAQWTTRTCIRMHRRRRPYHVIDSDNSDSDESGAYSVEIREATIATKESQIKKSLSYVL